MSFRATENSHRPQKSLQGKASHWLVAERKSGEVTKIVQGTGRTMKHYKDNIQQVGKIWHDSDNTKNIMSLQNLWKNQKKTS